MSKIETFNPAANEKLAVYARMTEAEAFEAVVACHRAVLSWRDLSYEERGGHLRAIAEVLRPHRDDLGALMTREMAKRLAAGRDEIDLCAAIFDCAAEQGTSLLADEIRNPGEDAIGLLTYRTIGVIYAVQAWNFPFHQPVRALATALIAGNGCVLKHASICAGCAPRLQEPCREAWPPPDIFRVLVSDHDVSDGIIERTRVRGVTMTGSDDAGRHIGAKAAGALGDPEDADADLGRLSSAAQLDKVAVEVEESVAKGAMILHGATRRIAPAPITPGRSSATSPRGCRPMTTKSPVRSPWSSARKKTRTRTATASVRTTRRCRRTGRSARW